MHIACSRAQSSELGTRAGETTLSCRSCNANVADLHAQVFHHQKPLSDPGEREKHRMARMVKATGGRTQAAGGMRRLLLCAGNSDAHADDLSEFTTRIYRRTRCRSDSEGKDFACFEQNAGHKHSAGADHSQAVARRKKFALERSRLRWAYEGLMAIVCVGKGEGYG